MITALTQNNFNEWEEVTLVESKSWGWLILFFLFIKNTLKINLTFIISKK